MLMCVNIIAGCLMDLTGCCFGINLGVSVTLLQGLSKERKKGDPCEVFYEERHRVKPGFPEAL